MNTFNTCAVDLGNSSGRVMKALFNGTKLKLTEVNRFSNDTIPMHKFLKVDFLHLFNEMTSGILKAGDVASIGIDSWAIDFGLLDIDDDLILTPHHHRDSRTLKILELLKEKEDHLKWYSSTGITFQAINTSLQLYSMVKDKRNVLEYAKTFLMIPDLMIFFLTGSKATEATNASNTQLISLESRNWDWEIINELGLPGNIFKQIVEPKTMMGYMSSRIKDYYNYSYNPSVITVGSHDTASAVHAIPFTDEDSVFISSGTWSLIGTILQKPLVSLAALRRGYNNERATDGRIRFIKNTHGMWIIEEILRVWELQDGYNISYKDISNAVSSAKPFKVFIDLNLPRFYNPQNMVDEVLSYIKDTNQKELHGRGEILRAVFEGLACSYKEAFDDLCEITEKKYTCINIVGGGSRNSLINQYTANICNVTVIAGPVEATTIGNVLSQLEYHGAIKSEQEKTELICNSFDIKIFQSENTERWNEFYLKYQKLRNVKVGV